MGLNKVQIGEIVPLMVEELEKGLLTAIEENKHRRKPYFVLFSGDWYKNGEELITTLKPSYKCPLRMLNTICWKIDNKSGRCEELWVLPKDFPVHPSTEMTKPDEKIAEYAKSVLPAIVYD